MSLLHEAHELAEGPRRDLYGHPSDNHGCTAALWRAYLERRYGVSLTFLDAHDVAMMNALQKISREANVRHRDNRVDLAGYAYNAEVIVTDERDAISCASDVALRPFDHKPAC